MSKHNLFTGLFIGALFALIFAPQKGGILRENMEKAHRRGEGSLKPLKRAVTVYFKEIGKQINKSRNNTVKKEINPFTVTRI